MKEKTGLSESTLNLLCSHALSGISENEEGYYDTVTVDIANEILHSRACPSTRIILKSNENTFLVTDISLRVNYKGHLCANLTLRNTKTGIEHKRSGILSLMLLNVFRRTTSVNKNLLQGYIQEQLDGSRGKVG